MTLEREALSVEGDDIQADYLLVAPDQRRFYEGIYDRHVNAADLRRCVGMVFQKPNPFPKSIYEYVAYGLRIQGKKSRRELDDVVENALWDEVKDRLNDSALGLSGVSRSVLLLPVPLPSNLMYCCWMNRPRHWIRSLP